jgi:O-antigen/teichoic acid export membrane protein
MFFLGISLFAKEIISLITSPQYYEASQLVKYLVPSILLLNMYIFAPGIGIAKKSKFIFMISFSGALLNTLLNIVLIPWLGTKGAAIATLIASFFAFVVYMILSQKFYFIPHQWRALVVSAAAVCILIIVGEHFNHGSSLDIVIKILIMIAAVMVFRLNGLIKKGEWETVLSRLFLVKEKI